MNNFRKKSLKTRIIQLVSHVIILMEKDTCPFSSSGTRDIAFEDFSRLLTVAILDVNVEMTSRLKNNHFTWFDMQHFVENDTSFALLAHLTPDILLLMFL